MGWNGSRISRSGGPVTRRAAMATALGAAFAARAQAEPAALRFNGTGSGIAMLRLLGEAWREADPRAVPLETSSRALGSAGGIAAVAAGHLDFSVSGRPLRDAERGGGMSLLAYARSPLVFATRRGLDAGTLTTSAIERMLAGEIGTWRDGSPILVVRRPPSDNAFQTFEAYSPSMERAFAALRRRPGVPIAATDIDNADMLEARHGSLGVIMLGQLLVEHRRLAPLTIDGLDPSLPAVREGRYKPTATLAIVLPAAPAPAATRFVEFLRTAPTAQELLAGMGHVAWAA